MAKGLTKKPRSARFFRLWRWALSSRLSTVTPLLEIVGTRDFVGQVMPIDTQYVAWEGGWPG
ncbi:hypothetical protein XAP412_1030021 [Xanthomonas phaseoli pv. phaseoli]|uniref:Uncharacterized protein n=1 Tax=Xanthomonas campestris pv. phaseoli TaxID=317013 RepID=A0AB38DVF7_XANCH|nr:hypothetical protein XAP412_1030021 [Xanthomonas phaseoli pv. phaseoli]SON75841.1 hypothetical protein XAP6984_1080021 [Xanthomonas phaseoli pv. phaseoli]SON77290.1 hypothetical protein XAP7430_1050022 [Xanthomonas phaseoli pv. phaseoli]SOO30463.1 hypothetical protein XAP6164_4370003 [Xanthomonas phaseoli pv. phaseoli]